MLHFHVLYWNSRCAHLWTLGRALEVHSWTGPLHTRTPQLGVGGACDWLRKCLLLLMPAQPKTVVNSMNSNGNSEFRWIRPTSTKKADHGAAKWPTVPVYLGLESFPRHRTFSATPRTILHRPAWLDTLAGCWAFGDSGKRHMEPVCDNPKCLSCTTSPALSLLNSLYSQ